MYYFFVHSEVKQSTLTSLPVKEECVKEEHIQGMCQDQKPTPLSLPTKCKPMDSKVVKKEKFVEDSSSSEQNSSTHNSQSENADKTVCNR